MHPIDGKTKILGLIGHGISHTLSPLIHNFTAKELGLNCVYLPFDIAPQHLATTLPSLWQLGAIGFNVTVPHKVAVGQIVTGSPISVNTLYRAAKVETKAASSGHSEGFSATSTDGEGFCTGLSHMGVDISSVKRLVILGSGGAVQALLSHFHTQSLQFDDITILRRSPTHDEALKACYSYSSLNFASFDSSSLATALRAPPSTDSLLIQATSAPLRGDDLAWLLEDLGEDFAGYKGSVADLVYGQPSELYQEAKRLGLRCQDGLPMLIEQARAAQLLWWQQAGSYDAILAELLAKTGLGKG